MCLLTACDVLQSSLHRTRVTGNRRRALSEHPRTLDSQDFFIIPDNGIRQMETVGLDESPSWNTDNQMQRMCRSEGKSEQMSVLPLHYSPVTRKEM